MALKPETVKRLMSRAGLVMVFGFGLLSIIATGGVGGLEGENVVSIEIVPADVTLNAGATQLFEVKVHTDDGGSDVTGADSWSSSDPDVATIAADGVATAVAAGITTITATKAGLSAETTLTVSQPPIPPPALTAITITPADPHIPLGTTQTLAATGTYEDGSTKDITNYVAWTSSNTGVATIDTSGVVRTVTKGTATITALRSGISSQTSVTVTDPALVSIQVEPETAELLQGASHAFTAIGTYSDSSTMDITTAASWTSSDMSVAAVNDNGLVTAKANGETTITATLQQISGAATVTVYGGVLQSITVSPASASVEIGFTQAFTAQGHFADGFDRDLTNSVTWSLSDSNVALLNQDGVITARATGSTDVIATLGAISGTGSLSVTADTLDSVSISPVNPVIALKQTLQFTATGLYNDGSEKDFTQLIDWSSSDTAVITIDANGLATSQGLTGIVTITATRDSFSSDTSLLVVSAGLPRTGQTTCYDINGNVIDDCSGTSQDGDTQSGRAWPLPRFTPGTGAELDCITDNLTGLMWAKDSIGSMQWQDALDYANSLNLCGHDDWRMPNIKEMDSLVDREQADSVAWLKTEGFANISNSNYWTSTTVPSATDRASDPILSWGVSSTALKTGSLPFLPVRNAQTPAAAAVAASGQVTCYDVSGVETECANTGQDGDLQQGLLWPAPRFVVGTDAEANCVTDKLTGLTWLKTPDSTPRTWQDALSYADSLNQCGYTDWRAPNIVELYSLYNAGEVNSATWLNSQGFSNVQNLGYWSSTTWALQPTDAFSVLLHGFLSYSTKTDVLYVWPVRGGSH